MEFKKTCFECGKKESKLFNGMCENCYKNINPPIKEIKPTNFKVCNQCLKVHYNNSAYTLDEIEEMMPNIMKARTILNEGYILNDLEIKDFKKVGAKLVFDVEVDCQLL
jgi:NMD protein affecting ribosome stability and mRNA decay